MRGYYEESDEVRRERQARERAEEFPNEEQYHQEGKKTNTTLHVFGSDDGGWEVWLNPDSSGLGLCIGAGDTREEAIADAVMISEWVESTLQAPSPAALEAMLRDKPGHTPLLDKK